MPDRATVTFRTTSETKARLEKLAAATRRSKSYLSNEALERFLAEEEAFIASVERGQDDARAGRVHDTNTARHRVTAAIRKSR